MSDQIAIGFIRTSHGVKGLLKVGSYSGEMEHFLSLKEITLKKNGQQRRYAVERVEPQSKGLLMKLQGVDTPEAGKALAQWEIWVDREQASPLEEGEFYHADLIGCKLLFQGQEVGKIESVIDSAKDDLLEVKRSEGKGKCLVPFVAEFIGSVDTDKKEVELLQDWILE